MNAHPDLSDRHIEIVRKVLNMFPGVYERVAVFGSRATGKARPNSDLDLVIRGAAEWTLLADIRMEFEESLLPLKVDLLSYETLTNERLRAHIDRVALPLPPRPALDEFASVAAE